MKDFKRNLISLTVNPKTESEPIYDRFTFNSEKKLIPDDVMLEVSREFGDVKIDRKFNSDLVELKHDISVNEHIMQKLLSQRIEEKNLYLNGVFQPEPPKTLTVDDILDMRSRMVDKPEIGTIETIDGEPPVWYVAPNVYQLLLKRIYESYETKSCTPMEEDFVIYGGLRIKPKACLPDNTYVTNIKERDNE